MQKKQQKKLEISTIKLWEYQNQKNKRNNKQKNKKIKKQQINLSNYDHFYI